MAFTLFLPAVLAAFLITILEMTEVVVLVVAVSADHPSARPGATGAALGVAVVALVAAGLGAILGLIDRFYLPFVSGVLLVGFGVFLFRSTLRSYRRALRPSGSPPPAKFSGAVLFGTGFTAGAVEAVETVIVLLGITAAGYPFSAVVGAFAAGGILVVLSWVLHERLRRIKVPWLKLLGTAMLFTFAAFWLGEAVKVPWPGADLFLLVLFALSLLIVRGAIQVGLRSTPPSAAART
ncbi:conserved hypothetical protein, membrane [mine drainage metagenome]|uniref:GDT1 family protein n=1 Tax=mine drainage metagenome TaxID=410659 RepID=T1A3J9_9ZZZZ